MAKNPKNVRDRVNDGLPLCLRTRSVSRSCRLSTRFAHAASTPSYLRALRADCCKSASRAHGRACRNRCIKGRSRRTATEGVHLPVAETLAAGLFATGRRARTPRSPKQAARMRTKTRRSLRKWRLRQRCPPRCPPYAAGMSIFARARECAPWRHPTKRGPSGTLGDHLGFGSGDQLSVVSRRNQRFIRQARANQ